MTAHRPMAVRIAQPDPDTCCALCGRDLRPPAGAWLRLALLFGGAAGLASATHALVTAVLLAGPR